MKQSDHVCFSPKIKAKLLSLLKVFTKDEPNVDFGCDDAAMVDVIDLISVRGHMRLVEGAEAMAKVARECADSYDQAQNYRRSLNAMKQAAESHEEERRELIEQIKQLRKEIDPDEIKLRILYGVEEATVAKDAELAAARGEIANLKAEVEELKRSKKRLREALDRLAKST